MDVGLNQLEIAFRIAKSEIGVLELSGDASNERILEYHRATTLKARADEVPWCAAFINWCLIQAGLLIDPVVMEANLNDTGGYSKDDIFEFMKSSIDKKKMFSDDELFYANQRPPILPTKSALARHFLLWGKRAENPQTGDIVVLRRNGAPSAGHVGFFINAAHGEVSVFGGNQNNSVCYKGYKAEDILGFRTY